MDSAGIFTYDSTLPTPRDRMRHTLGDTDPTQPLRYDETYDAMLDYYGDEATATAKMARSLAVQFGRQPTSVSIPGGPSVGYSDRVKTWSDTAKTIESAIPAGGVDGTTYSAAAVVRDDLTDATTEYRRSLDEIEGW